MTTAKFQNLSAPQWITLLSPVSSTQLILSDHVSYQSFMRLNPLPEESLQKWVATGETQ